ncbi:MAG TPA: hypothetical protein VE011_00815 [Candidatus Dormibacteraeota bacterium]|nr:hypothetical protein [Candidatus Dormibacteraeota bacterium]
MRFRQVSVALAAVVLAIAACNGATQGMSAPASAPGATQGAGATAGSAGGAGGGGAVSDPCTLLTQAEVSAAVGQSVGAGTRDIDPNECDFQYPPDAVPTIQASITIEKGSTFADLCGPGDSALGLTVTTIGGVGDGACFEQVGSINAGTNLTFSKGGGVFTVAVAFGANGSYDKVLAADKALALDAINHIP